MLICAQVLGAMVMGCMLMAAVSPKAIPEDLHGAVFLLAFALGAIIGGQIYMVFK